MAKLIWRVKLLAEFETGQTTEAEVARLERDEQAGLADLGLRLAAKQLLAAIQAQIVPAQVAVAGERRRACVACEGELASKGHYTATFRALFGDVPIRNRRLLTCLCQSGGVASINRSISRVRFCLTQRIRRDSRSLCKKTMLANWIT